MRCSCSWPSSLRQIEDHGELKVDSIWVDHGSGEPDLDILAAFKSEQAWYAIFASLESAQCRRQARRKENKAPLLAVEQSIRRGRAETTGCGGQVGAAKRRRP